MGKNTNLAEILKTIVGSDQANSAAIVEKLVKNYPDQAAKLAKELRLEADFDNNNVVISSARELSSAQKQTIENAFSQKYNYPLNFSYKIDEEILGGVILKKGERVIDNSLKTRINALKETINLANLSRGKDAK